MRELQTCAVGGRGGDNRTRVLALLYVFILVIMRFWSFKLTFSTQRQTCATGQANSLIIYI